MTVRLIGWSAMNTVISHLPGVIGAVHDSAEKIAAKAELRLAAHVRPFDATESSVTVTQGTVDSFVNLEDTGGGATGIEFGYRAENGKIVHGLHIVTGAAGLA